MRALRGEKKKQRTNYVDSRGATLYTVYPFITFITFYKTFLKMGALKNQLETYVKTERWAKLQPESHSRLGYTNFMGLDEVPFFFFSKLLFGQDTFTHSSANILILF